MYLKRVNKYASELYATYEGEPFLMGYVLPKNKDLLSTNCKDRVKLSNDLTLDLTCLMIKVGDRILKECK